MLWDENMNENSDIKCNVLKVCRYLNLKFI